jgi:hypothetical protein
MNREELSDNSDGPLFLEQHPCTNNDNTKTVELSFKNLKKTMKLLDKMIKGMKIEVIE